MVELISYFQGLAVVKTVQGCTKFPPIVSRNWVASVYQFQVLRRRVQKQGQHRLRLLREQRQSAGVRRATSGSTSAMVTATAMNPPGPSRESASVTNQSTPHCTFSFDLF